MAQKKLKTFQHYLNEQQETPSPTWTEVRDTLQMKRPFAILVFRTRSSYLSYLEENKAQENIIKQVATLDKEGKKIKYPSVFIILNSDVDYSDTAHRLYEKYDLKLIIAGQANVDTAKMYSPDGSSVELGNEIISTIEPMDFENDEYFRVGSTCYKFYDFQG